MMIYRNVWITHAERADVVRLEDYQALLAALNVARRELRHAPACVDTIERGAWTCSCGFNRAYDHVTAAIAKAEGPS